MIKKVGIYANPIKKDIPQVLPRLVEYLLKKGIEFYIDDVSALRFNFSEYSAPFEKLSETDCLFVLGGDGTLLGVARRTVKWGIPIFGINLGHMGFLTEIEVSNMEERLDVLFEGEYYIEDRAMIKCLVEDESGKDEFFAFNEVTISKGTFFRLMQVEVHINGNFVENFPADGVIVATPTGSTAYSLSAGGPILNPASDCFVITPICAHTLHVRPIVTGAEDIIDVKVRTNQENIIMTMDGQIWRPLKQGQNVSITKAPYPVKLLKLKGDRNFFYKLRLKLKGYEKLIKEGDNIE